MSNDTSRASTLANVLYVRRCYDDLLLVFGLRDRRVLNGKKGKSFEINHTNVHDCVWRQNCYIIWLITTPGHVVPIAFSRASP